MQPLSVAFFFGLLCTICAAAREPGLLLRIYQFEGDIHSLPELAPGQPPNAVLTPATLEIKDGGFGGFKDHFLTEVNGYLKIDKIDAAAGDSKYVFRLMSDDGSQLWIDGRLAIDNDGLHGATPKDSEPMALSAGQHALRIRHFENSGGEGLELQWKPPGASDFTTVPAAALEHDKVDSKVEPGKKRLIPGLRRGRPGDGSPLNGPHPALSSGTGGDITTAPYAIEAGWLVPAKPPAGGEQKTRIAWIPGRGASSEPGLVFKLPAPYGFQLQSPSGTSESMRFFLEQIDKTPQGCALRLCGPSEAALGPKPNPQPIFDILAVRAKANGFEVEFTLPLLENTGWEPESYYVEQWPLSPAGAAPQRDGIVYPVRSASVSSDRTKVFLEIPGLKTGHVVYLRMLPPCISEDGDLPWTTEAWYTLQAIPQDRVGAVKARPPAPVQNFLTEKEKAEGWRLLFDGKTTAGWHAFQQPAGQGKALPGWSVVQGCLVRTGPGGNILTDEEFDNFELKIEWRISPAGNSGIFYHVSEGPPNQAVWESGPEMQVLDNAEHPDGRNPLTSAGSNYALYAPAGDATRLVGLFNEARLLVSGNHVEHWLNGQKLLEFEQGSEEWKARVAGSKFAAMPRYAMSPKGAIALQDHGDRVWYRNIKIRPLTP